MHKLTTNQKKKIGGKLARIFKIKIDPKTGFYLLEGGTKAVALDIFQIAHAEVLHVEYLNAVKKAVEALESVSRDCQMALSGQWDKSDDGFEATRDSVDDALRGLGVEPPVETPEEDGNE